MANLLRGTFYQEARSRIFLLQAHGYEMSDLVRLTKVSRTTLWRVKKGRSVSYTSIFNILDGTEDVPTTMPFHESQDWF